MRRILVNNKGKKYWVNVADGCGDDGGVGPGASVGTLWMSTNTGSWYRVYITGSTPAASLAVSQSVLPYGDNSVGWNLLLCDDTHNYQVYLKGNPPTVTFNVSQSVYSGSASPKPDLLLQSVNDGNFYMVYLHNSASVIQALVNQTFISASWVYQSGIY
jgi:hypothetical protein